MLDQSDVPPSHFHGDLEPPEECLLHHDVFRSSVFVTMQTDRSPCYDLALGIFIHSFISVNSSMPLLVFYGEHGTVDEELRSIAAKGGRVSFRTVPLLKDERVQPRLKHMATKFQLWTLTCFHQVAYFDADHVFMANPDKIFDECKNQEFCAAEDSAPNGHRAGQFNAGAMVFTPSAEYAKQLVGAYQTRESLMTEKELHRSGDQIFLNRLRGGNWTKFNSTYNSQHGKLGIVVHDKIWKNRASLDVEKLLGGSTYLRNLLKVCRESESESSSKML